MITDWGEAFKFKGVAKRVGIACPISQRQRNTWAMCTLGLCGYATPVAQWQRSVAQLRHCLEGLNLELEDAGRFVGPLQPQLYPHAAGLVRASPAKHPVMPSMTVPAAAQACLIQDARRPRCLLLLLLLFVVGCGGGGRRQA